MINKIVDGIVDAISIEFGEGYEIYTESIEQGLQEPCFSVLILNPTSELFLNNKYMRTNKVMIQYFPLSNDKYQECNEVLTRLFECLELIYIGDDLSRGSNMNGEIVDGVLNFSINYDMFVYKLDDEEKLSMQSFDSEVKAREDE